MNTPPEAGPPPPPPPERFDPPPHSDEVVRLFVEHWGMMARSWGINATMGELFALLYITGGDWTAESLREWLQVSRGNVSMNLRELMAWGVVHKIHRSGERREFYRAEPDVWTLFRRILTERKKRELDPTLIVLERTVDLVQGDPTRGEPLARLTALREFFELINALAGHLLSLDSDDVVDLSRLLAPAPENSSSKEFPNSSDSGLPESAPLA